MDQSEFFAKYNIKADQFKETGLIWDDLLVIFEDYVEFRKKLEEPALQLLNHIVKASNVHYVRYRVKNAEHLIEKIIRKKIEEPETEITLDNYKTKITDLIGLRALHLFKEDWKGINDFLSNKCTMTKNPLVYYREGDDQSAISEFEAMQFSVKVHECGYRSIHYFSEVDVPETEIKIAVEIQVRTIFEEAWSEIDHKIRYPYYLDHKLFAQYLMIFNRLAGSADEMGTFIKLMQVEFDSTKKELKEKDEEIYILLEKLRNPNLNSKEIKEIEENIIGLKNMKHGTDEEYNRKMFINKFVSIFDGNTAF